MEQDYTPSGARQREGLDRKWRKTSIKRNVGRVNLAENDAWPRSAAGSGAAIRGPSFYAAFLWRWSCFRRRRRSAFESFLSWIAAACSGAIESASLSEAPPWFTGSLSKSLRRGRAGCSAGAVSFAACFRSLAGEAFADDVLVSVERPFRLSGVLLVEGNSPCAPRRT